MVFGKKFSATCRSPFPCVALSQISLWKHGLRKAAAVDVPASLILCAITEQLATAPLQAAEDSWAYASLECGLGFQLAVVSGELVGRTRGPTCELAVQVATPQLPLRLVPLFPIPVLRTGVQDALTAPHTATLPDFGCAHVRHRHKCDGDAVC